MLTLEEFRRRTANMPDSTMIFVDQGDCEPYETRISHLMPADLAGGEPLIILGMGQGWGEEINYGPRLDYHLEYGDD